MEVWKEECQQKQDKAEKRAWEEAERLVCKGATKKAQEEAKQKAQEEAERKVEEECKAQEEVARAKEEAERIAKEATGPQGEVMGGGGTVVAPLWVAKPSGRVTVVGPSTPAQRASGVQDPCTRCCNKGTPCVLGTAKGKTTACKACHHMKVSCSWTKRVAREMQKRKQVQQSEEAEDVEVVEVGGDDEEEEVCLHFVVLTHLTEEHQDALRALTTMLDTLSMDILKFWQDSWNLGVAILRAIEAITDELQRANDLKEEEMGKSKGKGKEREERPRQGRTEDEDGDMEMGKAGPSSLA
ncbi:hypothetical protein ID866_12052 [Astraeus odoratus]|nr:hypothetical protein ID866_12052 [Astraeus odoratus]